jgi:predicted NUDIX family NTP pyrophosphohydrolase
MPKRSAGLLVHRSGARGVEVLIVHPGGPLWARKDDGVWSIPKGEYTDEDPEATALREFAEELGQPPPPGKLMALGELKQPSGKLVTVFAAAGDLDADHISSNTFEMEWPPKSGTMQRFPEVDRAMWATIDEAKVKLTKGQRPFLDRLLVGFDQKTPLDTD